MVTKVINNSILIKMIQLGANNLANYKEMINQLNVFPVPDGDTGTNMNLSMQSGVDAVKKKDNESISNILESFVTGLLMGARGNSGVILSQIFKGFSEPLQNRHEITSIDLASAMECGVDKAYQAVTNPVEGTILTVAKDAAKKAKEVINHDVNVIDMMELVLEEAKASLKRTPELLPILKEVGVVDSGGKGLVVIYEGFLAALKGEELPAVMDDMDMDEQVQREHEKSVQSFMSADEIVYGYCTEFFVEFTQDKLATNPFNEKQFRHHLSEYGDSLLVASTDDFVKVHVHTEYPGKVMTIAQEYGDLNKIDIENMRKQHEALMENVTNDMQTEKKQNAVIAVSLGSGLNEMMTSIGATTIIQGGQTMNPSTEDILQAINRTNATTIFILPNNKNIVLAANQAKEITDKQVVVIPAKSIPQGIGALFAFEETETREANEANMLEALGEVKTGQVTYSTRDTVINGIEINKHSYIGLNDETIISTDESKTVVLHKLIDQLVSEEDELLTVFFGEDVSEEEADNLKEYLDEHVDIDTEYHFGNQPLYPYILMVE